MNEYVCLNIKKKFTHRRVTISRGVNYALILIVISKKQICKQVGKMMLRIVYLFLGFIGFASKKSKFISILIFILVIVLFGWNCDNPDNENYIIKYDLNNDSVCPGAEIGFHLICYIANCFHLSFQQFRIVLGLFCYILFFRTIHCYSKYPGLVSSVYLLFFFFIDVTQIRNFLSFTIVLFAFTRYIREDSGVKDILLYSLFILIATTIHLSSIFFILFIFALRRIRPGFILILVLIGGIIDIVIYGFIEDYFGKILTYNDNKINPLAVLFFSMIQLLNYYVIKKICKYNTEVISQNSYIEKNDRSNVILRCNMLLICLIPFYFTGAIYTRLFRFMAIINIIFLSNKLSYRNGTQHVMILITYALFFHILFNGFGLYSELANSVFDYNLFPYIK